VVILGYARYISVEALEKLSTFTKAGGTVILVGDTPEHGLRPEQEDAIATLMEKLSDQPAIKRYTASRLLEAVAPVAHRDLTATVTKGDQTNFLMADYEAPDRDVTFLVNAGYTDTTVSLTYTDGYTGKATLYHPKTGYIETVTVGEGYTLTIPACMGLILMREADNTRDDTPYTPKEDPDTPPADTSAPDGSDTTTPDDAKPAKRGCQSAVTASTALLAMMGAAVVLAKRKED
jgi:hypothetical protein